MTPTARNSTPRLRRLAGGDEAVTGGHRRARKALESRLGQPPGVLPLCKGLSLVRPIKLNQTEDYGTDGRGTSVVHDLANDVDDAARVEGRVDVPEHGNRVVWREDVY